MYCDHHMGARLTVLENKSSEEIEIRVWVHPDRADHFQKIIKIEPGGMETVKPTAFSSKDLNLEEPRAGAALFMIYADGVYNLLEFDLIKYAKVICDRNEKGQVIVRGIRAPFAFCRLKGCLFFPGRDYLEGPEEEIV